MAALVDSRRPGRRARAAARSSRSSASATTTTPRAKLLEIAADDDELPVVAAAAIVGLGRSSDDAAREAVEAALASESFNNERAVAAFGAIRESNDPRLAPALMRDDRRARAARSTPAT